MLDSYETSVFVPLFKVVNQTTISESSWSCFCSPLYLGWELDFLVLICFCFWGLDYILYPRGDLITLALFYMLALVCFPAHMSFDTYNDLQASTLISGISARMKTEFLRSAHSREGTCTNFKHPTSIQDPCRKVGSELSSQHPLKHHRKWFLSKSHL